MKILKNGLCAKVVMALMAVAGLLVTSCQQEDIITVFSPSPAKVTVTASVYDAVTGADVTSLATITGAGTTEYPSGVPAGTTITVTASYNGMSKSETITLNPMGVGGVASYHVSIVLDKPRIEGLSIEKVGTTSATDVLYSTPNAQSHKHVANGEAWFENASEYFYPWSVTYNLPNAVTSTAVDFSGMSADDAAAYQLLVASMTAQHPNYVGTIDWKASAWSLSRAKVTVTTETTLYNVVDNTTGKVLGTFTLVNKYASVQAEAEEMAHPSHVSHYEYTHGHDHGAGNAGGGIVVAD